MTELNWLYVIALLAVRVIAPDVRSAWHMIKRIRISITIAPK